LYTIKLKMCTVDELYSDTFVFLADWAAAADHRKK